MCRSWGFHGPQFCVTECSSGDTSRGLYSEQKKNPPHSLEKGDGRVIYSQLLHSKYLFNTRTRGKYINASGLFDMP